jgi:hypothetical protein
MLPGTRWSGRLGRVNPWASVCALSIAIAACVGNIEGLPGGGDGASPPTSTPTNFVCDPDAVPETVPLRRLSRVQYENTVRELVTFVLGGDANAVLSTIDPLFDQVPDDLRVGPDKHFAGYTHLDQAVQQEHVDATYAVANAVGAALTANSARLTASVGACATDADGSNDGACLDAFIRSFGERALRRAVTNEDVSFYKRPAGAPPYEAADYADVVALMMTSPDALYLVERGSGTGETSPLDGYALASRLSYHFWQTSPDEELFAAARSGELVDDEVFQAQVDRVFNSSKTRAAVATFFSEWLDNTVLEELDSRLGTPVFDAFAGDFEPGPDLRERMLDEVVDAATYYAFQTRGTFDDFFASRKSFARTNDLASIYGVRAWDGTSEPPDFGDPERVGLITRAAYVATGSANTRPIMKGVFIRKALLCDDIAQPPAKAAATPIELSDTDTTREVVEKLTQNGVCAGCHPPLINPLGFATEGFDALGRVRTKQTFYDPLTGAVVGSAPIDTRSVPHVEPDDASASNGPADLVEQILASEKPRACFARQYFRFTFSRLEDLDRDGCALADVKATLDDEAPLAEALRAIALSPAFRMRSF